MNIETRHERRRGCGYRKPGGLYLVSGVLGRECGKLPIPLKVCPVCGHGIKPSRGWTWVGSNEISKMKECTSQDCGNWCILKNGIGRVGLIWIGERYYKTPDIFTRETATMGVSRRIFRVPHGFRLGETWVLLGHRKAIISAGESGLEHSPGIFQAFKPTAIEYVVKGDESEEEIDKLLKRNITPLKVEKAEVQEKINL